MEHHPCPISCLVHEKISRFLLTSVLTSSTQRKVLGRNMLRPNSLYVSRPQKLTLSFVSNSKELQLDCPQFYLNLFYPYFHLLQTTLEPFQFSTVFNSFWFLFLMSSLASLVPVFKIIMNTILNTIIHPGMDHHLYHFLKFYGKKPIYTKLPSWQFRRPTSQLPPQELPSHIFIYLHI